MDLIRFSNNDMESLISSIVSCKEVKMLLMFATSNSSVFTRSSIALILALTVAISLSTRVLIVATSSAIWLVILPYDVSIAFLIASLYASVISAFVFSRVDLRVAISVALFAIAAALLVIAVAFCAINSALLAMFVALLAILVAFV